MKRKDENKKEQPGDERLPAANTGNASNPSPNNENEPAGKQLLTKKAEKYLRESGNIEDLPDAQEEDSPAK